MSNPAAAARQKQVSDAVYRKESAVLDDQITKQLLKTWPNAMPPGYANNIPYYQDFAKRRMQEIEHANADLRTLNLSDPTVVEYRRFKALRIILYFESHPINDLPVEVLYNIFSLVVWGTNDPSAAVVLRLRLTWVCRTWRSLLLADTTLWSSIWFRDPPPYERSFAWFERANTAPLSIRINEYGPRAESGHPSESSMDMSPEQVSGLLDRIFTKFAQIDIFIVILNRADTVMTVIRKLNEATRSGLPVNMRRFELHCSNGPLLTMDEMELMPLFGGVPTPSLDFVAINGVLVDWNNTLLSRLTTLDIRRIPIDNAPTTAQFLETLSSCPNLHKLVLDGAGPSLALPNAYPPAYIPTLHTLVIGDFSCEYLKNLLQLIHAPHVRDFTLMNLSGENYTSLFQLMTEIKSLKQIKILTIYSVEVSNDPAMNLALREWFHSMPNVQYLRLALAPHFLEVLTMPGIAPLGVDARLFNGVLCPRLDVLEFQHMDVNSVADWVKKRTKMGVPPQSLYVNSNFVHAARQEISSVLQPLGIALLVAPLGTTTPDELRIITEDDLLEDI